MRFPLRRFGLLIFVALCSTIIPLDLGAQTAPLSAAKVILQSPEALACQRNTSIDCLCSIVLRIAAQQDEFTDATATTRGLAGAGRFVDAYALAHRRHEARAAEPLFRIALQEVLEAAWEMPGVAADLHPIEAASAASANPKETMLVSLRMLGNELAGVSDDVDWDSTILSSYGRGIDPSPAVPLATVNAILATWRQVEPGSLGPVSVLLALGDRQSAIKETARLVSDPKMAPHLAAYAWAQVGEVERASAIEETLDRPRAEMFVEAADAMRRFGEPDEAVTKALKRALTLLTDPNHEVDYYLSPRRIIDGIAESGGRDAAMEAANVAVERSRMTGRRAPFLLGGIAAAYLDLGDRIRARILLREAAAPFGLNGRMPSYMVILLYRLGDHAGFETAMAAFGDDRDPRATGSSIRGSIWQSLIREKDVDPTLSFVTRAAVGEYAKMKPYLLEELAIRRMQQGRQAAVPQLIRAIAKVTRQQLLENRNDFFKTVDYEPLATAGQLSHTIHDRRGGTEILRVMIDVSFSNYFLAPTPLAKVASFWHRRLPEISRVP